MDPSIIGAGLGALGVIGNLISGSKQARQARRRNEALRQLAIREGMAEASAMVTGQLQRRVAMARELEALRDRAVKAAGAASAAGLADIQTNLRNFVRDEARYRVGLEQQEQFALAGDQNQLDRMRRDLQAKVLTNTIDYQRPNFALGVLQIGASAYAGYKQYEVPK